ncbi:helix-turn-helix domain-containing protein [Streptomyces sp. NPDC050658]|uniref:helix-turn-helix domain-containing protein n=1 Tax=unclassified Streptomyces TaxID=2593676 RepID=UPI0034390B5D
MKWNLRRAAAQQGIWRPDQLHAVFRQIGFNPSLSKVAALWSNRPITVRLDDLDMMCTALDCTVNDLLEAETVLWPQSYEGAEQRKGSDNPDPTGAVPNC